MSHEKISIENRISLIKDLPYFSMLADADLENLAKKFMEEFFPAGSIIVRQDDFIDHVYILISGIAEVIKKQQINNASGTLLLASLGPKEMIGLSGEGIYSATGRRTATVFAVNDVHVLMLSIEDFNHFIEKSKEIHRDVSQVSRQILLMNFFKKIVPFSHFSFDEFKKLSECVGQVHLEPDQIIFREGDIGDACYLIKSGSVEVFLENHPKKTLAKLHEGDMFGETAVLTEAPRNASVKALTSCELISLPREKLIQIIQKDFDFNRNMMQMILERSRPYRYDDISVHQRKTSDGRNIITLKNSKLGKYFRLSEDGYFIWENLNGANTLKDLTILLYQKFEIFSPEYICRLLFELAASGFIYMPTLKYQHVQDNEKVPFWIRCALGLRKIMEFQISVSHFDHWLTSSYKKFFHLFFTKSALFLMSCVIIIGLVLFVMFVDNAVALFVNLSHGWWLIPSIIIIDIFTIPLHELGHAYTAKAFGYEVNRFGIGWFWFSPVAFADTSDMWLSSKGPRLAVNSAGIFVDAVIGGLAATAAFFIGSSLPFLSVLLWFYALLAYYYIFKNLNPLLEFDGYYALMDLLDVPNLRSSSVVWLLQIFPKSFKNPRLFKENIPQIIYWLSCLLYIGLLVGIILFLQEYWLREIIPEHIFGVSKDYFRWILPLLAVVASILGIFAEFKYRLIRERNRF